MTRDELILSTLASAEGELSPVQIQKALFLLDRKASAWTGGPHFNFRAYDYGPFDQTIYGSLLSLQETGFVEIVGDPTSKRRRYALTTQGRNAGKCALDTQPVQLSGYISQISRFVQSLSFAQLVSSIYQEFPEMKANSVFRG